MNRPLRILYLIDYFHRTGGTERHLTELASALHGNGFDCTIVAFNLGTNPLIDRLVAAGVEVHCFPVDREYTTDAALQAYRLRRFIKSRRFDIAQTFLQKADTFGAVVAKSAGTPRLVSSKRDVGQLKQRRHVLANRLLRPLFDRFIAVCDAVADSIVDIEGVDRSRIVRIYNGIDAQRWAPLPRAEQVAHRRHLGFSDSDFVVGTAAGFRPEKDHLTFFSAMTRTMRSVPNLKVLAIGGGPLLDTFRARYAKEIATGQFQLPGAVDDVAPYLHAMDVACLVPSANEGFSNAVLEKMAVGLPLVVTDVGGNAEAVADGINGRVISPGDSDALADAIVSMHHDAEGRRAMGRQSRALVETRFGLGQMCRQHAALYRALVRDEAAQPAST